MRGYEKGKCSRGRPGGSMLKLRRIARFKVLPNSSGVLKTPEKSSLVQNEAALKLLPDSTIPFATRA